MLAVVGFRLGGLGADRCGATPKLIRVPSRELWWSEGRLSRLFYGETPTFLDSPCATVGGWEEVRVYLLI